MASLRSGGAIAIFSSVMAMLGGCASTYAPNELPPPRDFSVDDMAVGGGGGADMAAPTGDLAGGGGGGGGADLAEHALVRRRLVGMDLHRLGGIGHLAEQNLLVFIRPDDLAVALAGGAVDEPGADRVHPLDAGEIEEEAAALQSVEPRRQHAEPRQRQIPFEMKHAPAVLDSITEPGNRAHSRDMLQFTSSGK